MTIIIFTQSYPYDFAAEHIFVRPEIHHLAEKFEKILLVPRTCKGKRLSLPSGVEVDDRYADFLQRNSRPHRMIQLALASRSFFQEIHNHLSILLYPSKILKLILFSSRVELTRQWITNLIQTQQIDPNDCILYSYWFDHAATGLAMVGQEFPAIRVVSRAHGYDIYEEYYYPYYWPYRRETLEELDMLFFASDAGKNHFRDRYPEFISKFETAHLGIDDPGFISSSSDDGVFRIISCSYIVPVKRLGLLLDGIATAARLRPEQKFEWIHFGDGKGRRSLERKMSRKFPFNVQGRFVGDVPNHEIMRHYQNHPCDLFVNVSETEGGAPVSIQEAISCGIPVVATSVGGNPEIVSEKNGLLLSPDPTPEEIAAALLKICDNPSLSAEMRKESRLVWRESYNADINFRSFAERLKSIGKS
ncbi:MAG TPA: glycosyltransferase [Anaerolineales bacterium]|nr:glycosyltransferase [Anaerolineales bacterium]